RELVHLAPATLQRRGLLVAICALTIAPLVVHAVIELSLFPDHIGLRRELVNNVVPIVVALSLGAALWAPVASALDGSEPRRFWRPLALVLPATLVAGVMTDIWLRGIPTQRVPPVRLISPDLALLIVEVAGLVTGLLWLYAFGWHFPATRLANEPIGEA